MHSVEGEIAYDFENHLIRKGGVTVVYDGDGNRVSKTVGGVTTNYIVDDLNPTGYAQVLFEIVNGGLQRHYLYGLSLLEQVSWQSNTWANNWYGYDGHGSVRFLTDSNGTVLNTYDYDAFGDLVSQTGTTPNNYLFAGEQWDPDLGLYYNRARYLDVRTGRFWGMDTWGGDLESPVSLHKYQFVSNNPPNKRDRSGHSELMEAEGVAAGEASMAAGDAEAYQALTNYIWSTGAGAGTVAVGAIAKGIVLTLAGSMILGATSFLAGASPDDLLLRNGHNTDESTVLFAFGSATKPREPRIPEDVDPDEGGMIAPGILPLPKGASAFANPNSAPLHGKFHGVQARDVFATDGLSAIPDGSNVVEGSPHAPTHWTIYATRRMSVRDFIDKFMNLPWKLAGTKP